MRAVLDTNVLARAVPGSTGPAREVLELLAVSPHVLVTAPVLLDELTRALGYPRLRAIHGLDDAGIAKHVQDVEAASLVVPLAMPNVTAVQSDPDDNAVIAAAIAGQAEVICTRDRHFRRQDVVDFCAQHGIRILDDVALLNELRASAGPTPPQPCRLASHHLSPPHPARSSGSRRTRAGRVGIRPVRRGGPSCEPFAPTGQAGRGREQGAEAAGRGARQTAEAVLRSGRGPGHLLNGLLVVPLRTMV